MDAFDRIAARAPKQTKQFTTKMLDVADRIHALMEAKEMSSKDLALALNKEEAEVNLWLTGRHDLELMMIIRLEEVLGQDILVVPVAA